MRRKPIAKPPRIDKPKPCPFCGGVCIISGSGIATIVCIYCNSCKVTGPDFFGKSERAAAIKAVRHWNTRCAS
jgi:hypothetical protein